MRILFVNQFVPPDSAPTSRLITDLGAYLAAQGWEVRYIGAAAQAYQAGPLSGWRRLLRDLKANVRILWKGITGPGCDWVFCLSDPPGLVFTSAILARLKGAKLAHWAMDVYPEIAAALGALSASNPAYTVIRRLCHFGYDSCAAIGVLDDDMAAALGVAGDPRVLISPPWPPEDLPWPKQPSSPPTDRIVWLYSGNLGRAHDYETLLRAQKILEDCGAPFDLVFQGGGALRAQAQSRAEELRLRRCHWRGYADDASLLGSLMSAHVLIATQKTETRGLLWPSKLAVVSPLPRSIVWVGHPEGAISSELRLRQRPSIVVAPGEAALLADRLLADAERLKETAQGPLDSSKITEQFDTRRKLQQREWMLKLAAKDSSQV